MSTHLNKKNRPKIVNITDKKSTFRIATARGKITFSSKTFRKLEKMETKKGEINNIAIIAGIMGAKKTSDLIPLCHNINIENIDINIKTNKTEKSLTVESIVKTTNKTGVEMEALTSVAISCLTIYDMCKGFDKSIQIENIKLVSKKGGKSDYLNK